ncbi:MAG TPA: hypothetical protein VK645_19320 [Chitinophagaceae bacterium]|nr:hypothetical protein [Chitinophagaceae bacterium]
MSSQQPKPVFSIVLTMLLMGTIAVSCNNSADEKKEPVTDSTKISAPPPADTLKVDSVKMDTANTKPVKTTS